MATKPKPVKGQKLFLVESRQRCETQTHQCEVTKVGRKYFTVEWNLDGRYTIDAEFHVSNWAYVTEYCSPYRLYNDEQQYLDVKEANQLNQELQKHFQYGRTALCLETLRKIKALIDQETAS